MRFTSRIAEVVVLLMLVVGIKVAWDQNPEPVCPATDPCLRGYKVYVGTSSRNYNVRTIDVGNLGANPRFLIPDLEKGVLYFMAVTAYDAGLQESGFSNEVSGYARDWPGQPQDFGVTPAP